MNPSVTSVNRECLFSGVSCVCCFTFPFCFISFIPFHRQPHQVGFVPVFQMTRTKSQSLDCLVRAVSASKQAEVHTWTSVSVVHSLSKTSSPTLYPHSKPGPLYLTFSLPRGKQAGLHWDW